MPNVTLFPNLTIFAHLGPFLGPQRQKRHLIISIAAGLLLKSGGGPVDCPKTIVHIRAAVDCSSPDSASVKALKAAVSDAVQTAKKAPAFGGRGPVDKQGPEQIAKYNSIFTTLLN